MFGPVDVLGEILREDLEQTHSPSEQIANALNSHLERHGQENLSPVATRIEPSAVPS